MALIGLRPYIPSYGGGASFKTCEVSWDGIAKTYSSNTWSSVGLKNNLVSTQGIGYIYWLSVDEYSLGQHTLTINYTEGVWFDKNNVKILFSIRNTSSVDWSTDDENITIDSLIWDTETQITITFTINTLIKAGTGYCFIGFMPKTPESAKYVFQRNANIDNATCNYSNNEEIDINKPIYITADTGYQFAGDSYKIYFGSDSDTFTISDDKTKLTYMDFQSNVNYSINDDIIATLIPVPTYHFLLNANIVNATCNYNNNDLIDLTKPIVITALNGYQFVNTYYINWGDNTSTFTKSSDSTVLTFSNLQDGYDYTIASDIVATAIPSASVTITGSVNQATCNYTNGEPVNSYKQLQIVANTNYHFGTTFTIKENGVDVALKVNDDNTMLYYDLNGDYNYIIDKDIYATKDTSKYKITISGDIENATCNYKNNEYINYQKPYIIITANKGYEFKATTYYLEEGYTDVDFDISEDKTQLTYKLDKYNYNLNDEYVATKEVNIPADFVHLYAITKDELNALAKQRFNTSGDTVVDYGTFMTKLYYLPFVVPDSYIDDKASIVLGYYTSTTKASVINNDTFTFELPSITYNGKYNNAYDFKNIEFEINVPFFNKFVLDSKYVVGHEITFEIRFNVYSNKASLYVKSDVSDGYIYNDDCTLGVDIPFINNQNKAMMNNLGVLNSNLTNTVSLTVYRNTPLGTVDEYGHQVNSYVTIGTIAGYCTFDECSIISDIATDTEIAEIEGLLKTGVIIS